MKLELSTDSAGEAGREAELLHALNTKRTLFVADNTNHLVQMLPEELQRMTRYVIQYFGRTPGIFAPLIIEGRVQGALNVTGSGLIAGDTPALEAFANHLAIALEKVRLFVAMQQELHERRQVEEAPWRLQKLESLGLLADGIVRGHKGGLAVESQVGR